MHSPTKELCSQAHQGYAQLFSGFTELPQSFLHFLAFSTAITYDLLPFFTMIHDYNYILGQESKDDS